MSLSRTQRLGVPIVAVLMVVTAVPPTVAQAGHAGGAAAAADPGAASGRQGPVAPGDFFVLEDLLPTSILGTRSDGAEVAADGPGDGAVEDDLEPLRRVTPVDDGGAGPPPAPVRPPMRTGTPAEIAGGPPSTGSPLVGAGEGDQGLVAAPGLPVPERSAPLPALDLPRVEVPARGPDDGGQLNETLNLLGSTTYLACGELADGASVCAPAEVPVGTPVTLDLDGDPVTGVAGAEVVVHLAPDVLGPVQDAADDPASTAQDAVEDPAGAAEETDRFGVRLTVTRTQVEPPGVQLPGGDLPARVWVLYSNAPAEMRFLAGFDGRASTLSASQEVAVTLKSITDAAEGDVKVRGEVLHSDPAPRAALLFGFADLDTSTHPPTVGDNGTAAIHFEPVPESLVVDLRFLEDEQAGRTVIEGGVESSANPDVTAQVVTDIGQEHRELQATIEALPESLSFRAASEAVGAVDVEYSASAEIPRFALTDTLWPDRDVVEESTRLEAEVLGIPDEVHFTLDHPFDVHYDASDRVDEATVRIASFDANGLATEVTGRAVGVPATWDLTVDRTQTRSGDRTEVAYDADGEVDILEGSVFQRSARMRATLRLEGVPTGLTLVAEKGAGGALLDARTDGPIDRVIASYSNDFFGRPAVPATGDHLLVKRPTAVSGPVEDDGGGGPIAAFGEPTAGALQEPTTTVSASKGGLFAFARVSGLSGLTVDTRDPVTTSAVLEMETADPLTFRVDTPAILATGEISNIPSRVAVDLVRDAGTLRRIVYDASDRIRGITAHLDDRSGTVVDVELTGLPRTFDLDMNMKDRRVSWSASDPQPCPSSGPCINLPVGLRVDATAQRDGRTWDAVLDLQGIPREWTLGFDADAPFFRAPSGSLQEVVASLTNHGSVTSFSGNHLSVVHDADSGDLDASFRMTDIHEVAFRRTGDDFSTDLRMGGGNPFFVHADVRDGTTRLEADVLIDPLPTRIHVEKSGDGFLYDADRNFELRAVIDAGHVGGLSDAPDPPMISNRLAVRDGRGCVFLSGSGFDCGTAVKARLFVFGFPTLLAFEPTETTSGSKNLFRMENFDPPASRDLLSVDVELDDLVSPGIDLFAVQRGIPRHTDITFEQVSIEKNSGDKVTRIRYQASDDLGKLTVKLERGGLVARAVVSNIPDSIDVKTVMGKPTSRVRVTLSDPISKIDVRVRLSGQSSFTGGVVLTDVPRSMDLRFGRIKVGSQRVPGATYDASDNTLDVTAWVDAELMGGDVKARARARITNLAERIRTHVTTGPPKVTVTSKSSSGSFQKTDKLEVVVWAVAHFGKTWNEECKPKCSGAHVVIDGHARADITVKALKLRIENFRKLELTLGITSAIEANFASGGSFLFKWQRITVHVDVDVDVDACSGVTGCFDVAHIDIERTRNIDVWFHHAKHRWQNGWWSVDSGIPCSLDLPPDTLHLDVDIKPDPVSKKKNRIFVTSGNWLITPDPWDVLPDRVAQAVAAFASPLGGGFDVHVRCR